MYKLIKPSKSLLIKLVEKMSEEDSITLLEALVINRGDVHLWQDLSGIMLVDDEGAGDLYDHTDIYFVGTNLERKKWQEEPEEEVLNKK